jgi:hypothetical protein
MEHACSACQAACLCHWLPALAVNRSQAVFARRIPGMTPVLKQALHWGASSCHHTMKACHPAIKLTPLHVNLPTCRLMILLL